MLRLLDMADKLVSTVPFYILNCDRTASSVQCAYRAVKAQAELGAEAGKGRGL